MHISFDDVMGFHPDNAEVYGEVRDNLGQLLPFVGSGLTADVYGTWRSTLFVLASRIADDGKRAEIEGVIESGDFYEASQLLEDVRHPLNLERNLVHYLSREKLEAGWSRIEAGAIWLLPDLFRCPILTTNFDEAIETVYSRRGFAPVPVLDPTSPMLRTRAARMRNNLCVFKLHGTVAGDMTDYHALIYTKSQTERHYARGGEARKALSDFISARNLFFLGCGLYDGGPMGVLHDAAGQGAIHYAITECSHRARDTWVRELADAGIRAIVYEEGRHESVRAVLEQLVADTRGG